MGVLISAVYQGELRCRARHTPSGYEMETDAPADNCGKAQRFSPTDLVATALGTCIMTTIGILAQRKGWNVDGMRVEVVKEMSTDTPRRIVRLPVQLWMPRNEPPEVRTQIENTARTCPVHKSIAAGIDAPVLVHWTS